jgi:hypothetical protein
MQVERRDIESNLPRKGFIRDERSKHTYFHHLYNGKRTGVSTHVSRGSSYDVYADDLLGSIKRELCLNSTRQAFDLCACPMDGPTFNQILAGKGKLSL